MQVFRYANGVLPNSLAFAYVVVCYPLSLWRLTAATGLGWLLACLLLAHALVISAYLLHECIHNTIFRHSRHNRLFGRMLAWITGAAYTPFHILEKKHLRHHADRVDVLAIDCRRFLASRPWLEQLLLLMQRAHLPAVEIFTHTLSVAAPFILQSRQDQRLHASAVLASRLLFFGLLGMVDISILSGYLLAWLLFLTVLGFMDTFQHHYEVRLRLDDEQMIREFDRDYEETHTFSNLLSTRYPLLNLLVLNFCYHNVHHYRSGIPWYELPKTHIERYKDRKAPVITLQNQLLQYHRYRTVRLLGPAPGTADAGAAGVSFLVGV